MLELRWPRGATTSIPNTNTSSSIVEPRTQTSGFRTRFVTFDLRPQTPELDCRTQTSDSRTRFATFNLRLKFPELNCRTQTSDSRTRFATFDLRLKFPELNCRTQTSDFRLRFATWCILHVLKQPSCADSANLQCALVSRVMRTFQEGQTYMGGVPTFLFIFFLSFFLSFFL